MAIINNRRGTPDPEILRAFIDTTKYINYVKAISDFDKSIVNREQIVTNQAIAFFLDQQQDSAWFYKGRLMGDVRTKNKADVDKLNKLFTFIFYYETYLSGGALPESVTQETMQRAESYVRNSNVDNSAVINTELHKKLKKKRADVEPLVDNMADDNPRKWYLKGILWCDEAGKEPAVPNGLVP